MDDDAQVCLAVEATRYSIPCSTPACIFVSVASRRRLALAHSRALPGWVTRRAGSDSDRRSGTSTVAGFFSSPSPISHLSLHWLSPPVSGSSTHLVFLYAQIDSQTDRIGRLAEHHLLQPPASHCPLPTAEEFRRLAVDRVEMAVQLSSQEDTRTHAVASAGPADSSLALSTTRNAGFYYPAPRSHACMSSMTLFASHQFHEPARAGRDRWRAALCGACRGGAMRRKS
jgi:hypothetical protein